MKPIVGLSFLIGLSFGCLALMSARQPGVAAAGIFGLGLFAGLAVAQVDRMFFRK